MSKPNPLWRQAFDAVEQPLRRRAEAVAGTEEFSRVLMTAFGVWTSARRGVLGASTTLLHLANLPAYADLRRLRRQLGHLENRIEKLDADLDRLARRIDEEGLRPRKKRA